MDHHQIAGLARSTGLYADAAGGSRLVLDDLALDAGDLTRWQGFLVEQDWAVGLLTGLIDDEALLAAYHGIALSEPERTAIAAEIDRRRESAEG